MHPHANILASHYKCEVSLIDDERYPTNFRTSQALDLPFLDSGVIHGVFRSDIAVIEDHFSQSEHDLFVRGVGYPRTGRGLTVLVGNPTSATRIVADGGFGRGNADLVDTIMRGSLPGSWQ
jgi:hypothetical protein